ncbi:TonB-dependent receptor [Marinibactrum halimedae]|uniref:TonB-dependent receptor n=1 Tax=Marinibactrum halimedae TaxID=1444977 RepID=A0AA37T4V6_9GAMM|nr:TonB-dependent receptor [Marinibactrum halimedae]MCD9459873.1 TonB-dependent receptor [Marinibactrum halimedae]GLS25273.1 TonB-dependent receptor [Marinibactrum halimedae]
MKKTCSMHFHRSRLAISISSVLGTFALGTLSLQAPLTLAQSQQSSELMEEVVVSGIRRSLKNSMDMKMNSSSIIEAVSAEDIGKLPDSSIAESIARLPGLAAQRLDGRASSISIRGLGENFSATTLNGREQVSIGDNRGVEFDVYPSEIMSGVVVQKSPDATVTTQGIAGVIDLQTVRPIDHGEQTIQMNVTVEQNDIGNLNPDGDDQGHRATFSYIDQFADGKVGVAFAAATMESPNNEERWEAWGYPTTDDGDFVLGGAKPFVRSSMLNRDTYMGVFQYEPNDRLNITADALRIDFLDEKTLRGIEIPAAWGSGVTPQNIENGFVTSGVINDAKLQVRNDFEQREADLQAYGLNIEYFLTDNIALDIDYSNSSVERKVWSLESYSSTGRGSDNGPYDTLTYTQNSQNSVQFTPSIDYSDTSVVQLGGGLNWGNGVTVNPDAQDGFINIPEIEDELDTLKLALTKSFDDGLINSIEGGIYYSDRTKSKEDTGIFLTLNEYPDTRSIPDAYLEGTVSLDFIGMGNMVAYDSFQFWQDGNYIETEEDLTVGSRSTNDWSVTEEITMAFAKADFSTDFGNIPLNGNIGLQIVHSDQSSTGKAVTIQNDLVDIIDARDGISYTDYLPSVNLSFELSENRMLRVAASRTMSRSRMDRMNAGFSYGFDNSLNVPGGAPFTAEGGNPRLEPNRANQYDLSYEWYYHDEGYVSAALFYKDLRSWQITEEVPFDMAELINANLLPPSIVSTQGLANLWVNSDGGDIQGLELTASVPGSFIADSLEGFGAIASATFIDSSVETSSGEEIQVPGLSENIFNLTLYYERNGFQVRTSMRKRDDFTGERFANSFQRETIIVQGAEIWDAQLSYDFEEANIESLSGLILTLQAQNLTDEPYTTVDTDGFIRDHQVFGRNFLIGASYRF